MTTWHSVFWSPAKHRWLVRVGADGRAQRQITVPASVAPGPRSKKAAEVWATEHLAANEQAAEQPPAPKTLAELAPLVLPLWAADERLAPKTKSDRESHLRLHVLPAFGALPVDALDAPRVRAWVRMQRQRGDSPPAIRNRLSTLATLLSDLHAEGHVSDNRVATSKAVRDELPALMKRSPVALPPSALEQLVNDAEVPAWFALLSALAGLAGLEAGAALGLEVRDVRIVDGVPVALSVRQSVAMLGADGHASIGKTKNVHRGSDERPRIVPVHPALAVLIARWLEVEREIWTCTEARPHDLLVPSASGKPWRPKVAERLRKELLRIGVEVPKGLDFHGLRRCFLTWLAVAGVAKDVRQRLAGHAGDVEAEHYEQASQLFDADRESVARIAVRANDERYRTNSSTSLARTFEDTRTRDRLDAGHGSNGRGPCETRQPSNNEGIPHGCVQLGTLYCDGVGGETQHHDRRLEDQSRHLVTTAVPNAVPFAVRETMTSAQQTCETACDQGAPGKNRTCDQRFRNSQALCLIGPLTASGRAERSITRHKSNGTEHGSDTRIVGAVPDAVREGRDGLRWSTLTFDAADAMLEGLS